MLKASKFSASSVNFSILGKKLPSAFYEERDAIQQRWITEAAAVAAGDFTAFSRRCLQEAEFFDRWAAQSPENATCSAVFRKRWQKKSDILFKK